MNPFLIALLMFFGSTSIAAARPMPQPQYVPQNHWQHHRMIRWQQSSTSPALPMVPQTLNNYYAPAPAQQQTPPTASNPLPAVQSQPTGSDFVSLVEQDVFAATNAQRQQNGLPALTWNSTLASVARRHSADMLANNYFNHNDLSGCSPSCRISNAGYAWQSMGENIYMMSGYNLDAAGTANQIVQGWMNSPEHRANILDASYTQTGVGIAVQGSTVYATTDYANPR